MSASSLREENRKMATPRTIINWAATLHRKKQLSALHNLDNTILENRVDLVFKTDIRITRRAVIKENFCLESLINDDSKISSYNT